MGGGRGIRFSSVDSGYIAMGSRGMYRRFLFYFTMYISIYTNIYVLPACLAVRTLGCGVEGAGSVVQRVIGPSDGLCLRPWVVTVRRGIMPQIQVSALVDWRVGSRRSASSPKGSRLFVSPMQVSALSSLPVSCGVRWREDG